MSHAYTEDQQAPRTLTRPLPAGEEVEQPAKAGGPPSPWPSPSGRGNDGLFAEQSAWPNPQPGLSATLLPLGEGLGDEGAQLALPPEAITAAEDELTRDRSAMSLEAANARKQK